MQKTGAMFLGFLLFFYTFCNAQNEVELLKKVGRSMDGYKTLSMDVTYSTYVNFIAATPTEVVKGKYIKRGKDYYNEINGIISMKNSRFLISVDPSEQSIVLTNSPTYNFENFGISFDSIIHEISSLKVLPINEKSKMIRIEFKEIPYTYDKIEIVFDVQDHLIKKLILYYSEEISLDEDKMPRQKPRMEITFSNVIKNKMQQEEIFSDLYYITARGTQYTCSEKFKGFTLLDQRIKK